MLREHPQITGFTNNKIASYWTPLEDEGQFLQGIYPPALVFGGPGSFAFAHEMHLTEASELLTPENKPQLVADWPPYWDLSKPYLLERSPPHLVMTCFLQSVFPNSSFLIIIRQPVAVSLATSKWNDRTLEYLVEHWIVAHEIFYAGRPHLRSVMTVRYETLAEDPAGVLSQIYRFLGLAPHQTSFAATTEDNQRYFAQWREKQYDPQTGPVMREWLPRYEPRVGPFGYSLEDLARR